MPRELFALPITPTLMNPYRLNYSATKDGQRFLVSAAVPFGAAAPAPPAARDG